jgi:hypothetical protein
LALITPMLSDSGSLSVRQCSLGATQPDGGRGRPVHALDQRRGRQVQCPGEPKEVRGGRLGDASLDQRHRVLAETGPLAQGSLSQVATSPRISDIPPENLSGFSAA